MILIANHLQNLIPKIKSRNLNLSTKLYERENSSSEYFFRMHDLPRNYCHIKNLWTSFSLIARQLGWKKCSHNLFMSKDKHKQAKNVVPLKNWWREWKANIYRMRDLIKRRSIWPLVWSTMHTLLLIKKPNHNLDRAAEGEN